MKDVTQQFNKGKIFPVAIRLILPAVIAQLISFVYNLVDRMFVSGIEQIRTQALAALGVVLPITIIVQAFANLIGLGGSPRASFKLGEGDKVAANKCFNNSFISLVAIGAVLTVLLNVFAEPVAAAELGALVCILAAVFLFVASGYFPRR